MTEKKVSALVPMKAHSERVPSKNTRLLGGVPLFYHVLRSLESAANIREILVDTDSDMIKELLAEDFPQVIIINRPPELLGTKVPMTPIITHDLQFAGSKYFMQTHVTSPFIKPATFDAAVNAYFAGLGEGFDSVLGVNRYQTRFYGHDGKPINHNPDIMVPSQDMPYIYEDNSSFYVNSVENFKKYNNRVGRNPRFLELPKLEAADIDNEEDFAFCEALYEFIEKQKKR
ncbi:MAG: hypothetical protein A2293_13070 [Elusimicrobia bacterium RIFOXYB2_FULL_49_7]|nr:MAG: hypothetical protein A2293_13070 [Elusimicrobia bacterium RIFOXYB2_FULL_49_7]